MIDESMKMTDMKKRYVSIREISVYTSIPVKTLYEWSSVGKIPCIRLGRKLLFDVHEIDQLMASMKCNDNKEEKIVNKIVEGVNAN